MTHCTAGNPRLFPGARPLSVPATRGGDTAATDQGRELHQGQRRAGSE